MLYVTTRNDQETFTAQHILKHDRGPDGGFFVPFHCPDFSKTEINNILNLPFDQCMAQVLNRLLGTNLTGWDVSFYTGRYPIRIKKLGYRALIAEGWHNPGWSYAGLVQNLVPLLNCSDRQDASDWLKIAVAAGVYAGICSEIYKQEYAQPLDIVTVSGDFTSPIGAWYTKGLGFPIGNILCCCNENGNLWDLIANGQMRTDGVSIPTETPQADIVIPAGLEHLIYGCGGVSEVERYLVACQQGKMYVPSDLVLEKLRSDIYVSVVSSQRVKETIPRVYASRDYLLSPYDALCYCGLSDYRARFGETAPAVIFSESGAKCHADVLAGILGLSREEIKQSL